MGVYTWTAVTLKFPASAWLARLKLSWEMGWPHLDLRTLASFLNISLSECIGYRLIDCSKREFSQPTPSLKTKWKIFGSKRFKKLATNHPQIFIDSDEFLPASLSGARVEHLNRSPIKGHFLPQNLNVPAIAHACSGWHKAVAASGMQQSFLVHKVLCKPAGNAANRRLHKAPWQNRAAHCLQSHQTNDLRWQVSSCVGLKLHTDLPIIEKLVAKLQMWGWSSTDIVTASLRNIASFSLPRVASLQRIPHFTWTTHVW